MKKSLLNVLVLAGLAVFSIEGHAVTATAASVRLGQELQHVGVQRFIAPDYQPGIVRHVVLFRYRSDVTASQRSEVIERFLAMRKTSLRDGQPFIVSIETGGQHSGEGADQELEQAFVVTFRSQGDRNYYVGQPVIDDQKYYDPVHQRFKDFVGPLLASGGVVVFDYTVEHAAQDPSS
jgi:head-tail adaptor